MSIEKNVRALITLFSLEKENEFPSLSIYPSGTDETFEVLTDLDIRNNSLLVHGDGEDLAPPVDTDDAVACVMLRRHEDGVGADPVLVDQGSGLNVVQVDVSVLCDQIHNVVLL